MDDPLTLNELNDVLLITVSIIVVVPPTVKLPLTNKLFKLVDPDTLNYDNNVDALETNKLEKLVFLLIFVENVENVVVST
jgi:hypothetical protein